MKFDRLRGFSRLSSEALENIACDLERREERKIEKSFRRFLDREGIEGDERSLALGEIDVDEFKARLLRFFGFGLTLAAAALFVFSMSAIFSGSRLPAASTSLGEKRSVLEEPSRPSLSMHHRPLARP